MPEERGVGADGSGWDNSPAMGHAVAGTHGTFNATPPAQNAPTVHGTNAVGDREPGGQKEPGGAAHGPTMPLELVTEKSMPLAPGPFKTRNSRVLYPATKPLENVKVPMLENPSQRVTLTPLKRMFASLSSHANELVMKAFAGSTTQKFVLYADHEAGR